MNRRPRLLARPAGPPSAPDPSRGAFARSRGGLGRSRRRGMRRRLAFLSAWTVGLTVLAAGVPAAVFGPAASATPARSAAAAATLDIVPKPVSAKLGRGRFTLTRHTRIVAAAGAHSAAELPVARDLAAYLRPATGYRLPAVTGLPRPGDITAADRQPRDAQAQSPGRGLPAWHHDIRGEDRGPGSARALRRHPDVPPAPARVDQQPEILPGPWTAPVVTITDYPRYSYRGLLLDIARHYEPPSAVEELISQIAAYKIDVLHLHLSDDQGFRLTIHGFPRLTSIGSRGSVGTGGRQKDPGASGRRRSTRPWWPMRPRTSSP